MTSAQRAKFFGTWWPAACEAQGWDPADEAKRRALVAEATGGATDRMSACTQAQLTAVFELAWLKADPLNLKRALPVANPADAAEADEQRRAVYALCERLPRAVIARIAAPLCRRHRVRKWEDLPSAVLKPMLYWKQFKRRPAPEPAEEGRTYYLRAPSPLSGLST